MPIDTMNSASEKPAAEASVERTGREVVFIAAL
jgi:hypothetical protein